MPRLDAPIFYYALEDVMFEEVKKKEGLTWFVHRPDIIFGFSPYALMNIIGSLCIDVAICKYEGALLMLPRTKVFWEYYFIASDADLIADQEIWACVDPKAKNEAFNTHNGDVFKWKYFWKVLAEQFRIEKYGFEEDKERVTLVERMNKIVKENQLLPTKLEDVEAFWFLDIIFSVEGFVSSMNKSKAYGFVRFSG